MYRLLIVDDEEIIVDGLAEIFRSLPEPELDVYRAYSGAEAIEWLSRSRIDVVLTDIRMPGIDGLQLMDRILEAWPHCRIIFLTGYDEFDYVYRAIRHAGVQYLLKTEDHDKVIAAVQQAVLDIERGNRIEDLLHKAREQMSLAHGLFQRDYLLRLLAGDDSVTADSAQFEQFGMPLDAGLPVHLMVGMLQNQEAERSYRERVQEQHALRLITEQHLQGHGRLVTLLDDAHHLVVLVQPRNSEGAAAVPMLRGIVEMVQNACRSSLDTSVSVSLTGASCPWETLPDAFDRLCRLLHYRMGSSTEMLLIDTEVRADRLADETSVFPTTDEALASRDALSRSRKQVDALAAHLEAGHADRFLQLLGECAGALRDVRSRNCNQAVELYFAIATMLLGHVNRWRLAEPLAFRIGLGSLMRLEDHAGWSEAVDYLVRLSEAIVSLQRDDQGKRADFAIEVLHRHIETHLAEDLSLVRLAELVFLNPSYLSRLYKGMTGRNLSEHIDQVRLQRAKELMAQRDGIRIHEVARQVGYDTAASFTRFFRKGAGMSPQEYLESVQKGKARSSPATDGG